MQKDSKIVVTGAAGFIGSCMVKSLNEQGYNNLILVDNYKRHIDNANYIDLIKIEDFFDWLDLCKPDIDTIIHLGANSDTTEFDYSIHEKMNLEYSKDIWNYCTKNKVKLIYASSAATYGMGEFGYDDNQDIIKKLQPLNAYGKSKNEFDKWVLQQEEKPPSYAGLKFFNVYGANESHKGRMASMVWHSYNQIKKDGVVKLFKSHKEGYKDGEQLRDFIYVKDVIKVINWICEQMESDSKLAKLELETYSGFSFWRNGIYNLGTGYARTFHDLALATFKALRIQPNIEFIDMPEDLRETYQYFTEAEMFNLPYPNRFYSLENGIADYVRHLEQRNSNQTTTGTGFFWTSTISDLTTL